MSQSIAGQDVEEEGYDPDQEFAEAIKALREASWRLTRASYALFEQREQHHAFLNREAHYTLGLIVGAADLLSAQVSAIASQVRKLRKQARDA